MTFEVSALCRSCAKCVKDCAMGVLEMKEGRPAVKAGREGACMNCQHCLVVCPEGAVTLNGVGPDDCQLLETMPIPPTNEVANLLMSRRSVRQFIDHDVPRAEIAQLLEVLKYVPTGCNVRHLVFKVVDSASKLAACRQRTMELLLANLAKLPPHLQAPVLAWKKDPKSDFFFRGAPHVLIVHSGPGGVTPQVDCDAACAYFDVLAQTAGYGTTWFGLFTHIAEAIPEVLDIFGVPRDAKYHAMLFGEPLVDYVRCVNRADGARIEWL